MGKHAGRDGYFASVAVAVPVCFVFLASVACRGVTALSHQALADAPARGADAGVPVKRHHDTRGLPSKEHHDLQLVRKLADVGPPTCKDEVVVEMIGNKENYRNTCANPIFGPQHSDGWSNRLLVVPELKFAFCFIEKNACTQFNTLMNHLNGIYKNGNAVFLKSSYETLGLNLADITPENGWRRGIFLRDPAERLLSAWYSKCIAWEDDGYSCLGGARATEADATLKFQTMVREFLPTYGQLQKDRWGGAYNAHYDQQTHFCGHQGIESYDYVGFVSNNASRVHEQVMEMLVTTARVPPERLPEVTSDVDFIFPRDRVAGHSTNSTGAIGAFYADPAVAAGVREFFAEDYDLLSRLGYQTFGLTDAVPAPLDNAMTPS